MSKLKGEELLKELKEHLLEWYVEYPPQSGETMGDVKAHRQAYKQIVALINRTSKEVTEEWEDEKASELITIVANLYPYEGSPCVIPKGKAKDFTRSLIKEIHGRK